MPQANTDSTEKAARAVAVPVEPIFATVQETARLLALSIWQVYELLDRQLIKSQYQGRRRLVSVESLKAYAANLPTFPDGDADG